MDEVALCRRAARDAVRDIEPDRLRAVMDDLLSEASMTPGVLTLRVARTAEAVDGTAAVVVESEGDRRVRADGTAPTVPDHVAERAAGVQLIYEGLRLIRRLADEDPWALAAADDRTEENLAVLAADVLVSRGFYLLARTSAADKAVETVRNFGRDQTLAREDTTPDRGLEADVLQLALLAGTAGTPVDPTPGALSEVARLAASLSASGGFSPAASGVAGLRVTTASGAGVDVEGESDGATRTSTSATDS